MPVLYAYDVTTRVVCAVVTGPTDAIVEGLASERYQQHDEIAWTYSPGFGTAEGLLMGEHWDEIESEWITGDEKKQ